MKATHDLTGVGKNGRRWLARGGRAVALSLAVLLFFAAPARTQSPIYVTSTGTGNGTSWGSATVLASAQTQSPIYVTPTGTGNGTSWGSATTLRNALRTATSGAEIWVAAGVYTPGLTIRDTFTVTSGIKLYGGFAATETQRTQRNWVAHPTVLSGDLEGNDIADANGMVTSTANITGTNAYHVLWLDGVVGDPITATTYVDGFTITAGRANGTFPHNRGGGLFCDGAGSGNECSPTLANLTFSANSASAGGAMYNNSYLSGTSNPTLTHVTFRANSASSVGGAMYNYDASSPTLTHVTFSANSASAGGGAMYNYGASSPTLTHVTFSANSAAEGGAMYNYGASSPTLTHVTFSGNSASLYGGAMYNLGLNGDASSPTLTHVTFSANSASLHGGAMYNLGLNGGASSPTLTNVIFSANSAAEGGAVYNRGTNGVSSPTLTNVTFSANSSSRSGGAMYNLGVNGVSSPTLTNVILWGNTAPAASQILNSSASITLTYSLIQGGCPTGASCSNMATGAALLGALGDYGGGIQTHPLLPGSAAIDAGNSSACPATDPRGVARVNTCDIGAFESQGFTLNKTGGDAQSTLWGTTFGAPLTLAVSSSYTEPVDGGIVTFVAPASGASTTPITNTATLAGGVGVFTPTASSIAGSYIVTASATGASPAISFLLTNTQRPALTTLESAPNPAVSGQTVTFTATVSDGSIGAASAYTPTGFVTFTVGTIASTVSLVNGVATYSTAQIIAGSHLVTATYGGDANYLASTSSPLTQTVQYAIGVRVNPTVGGTVSGGGIYDHGATAIVTATANTGYIFVAWQDASGQLATTASYVFTAATNQVLTATFAINTYTVTVGADPAVGGTASGGGLYHHGSAVTVTATANSGYTFVAWQDASGQLATTASYVFTATDHWALTATFAINTYTVTVSADPAVGGTANGGGLYSHGNAVTVTATANTGYAFVAWSEGGTPVATTPSYSFAATANRTLVATFTPVGPSIRTITLSANPAAGGTVSGGGTVNDGTLVTVTATANSSYAFVAWSEGGTPVATTPSYSFVATANRTLVATFTPMGPNVRTITLSADPAAGGTVSGGGTVNDGTLVTVTATANSSYAFVAWSEGGTPVATAPSYSFVATANRTLVATFTAQPQPLAVNDAAGVLEGEGVDIAVLANDQDPAGTGLLVAAVAQPAHGATSINPGAATVRYVAPPSFSGVVSFTYTLQDANGQQSAAIVAVRVTARSETDAPPQVAPVNPTVQNTLNFTSAQAAVTAVLPAGFFTGALAATDIFFLSYTPVVTPTAPTQLPPGTLQFGNVQFDLTAILNDQPLQGLIFARPVTLTLVYDPALMAGLALETMELYYWNGTSWSTQGISLLNHDIANATLTVTISHLSEFALFAALDNPTAIDPVDEPIFQYAARLYLPAVLSKLPAATQSAAAMTPEE